MKICVVYVKEEWSLDEGFAYMCIGKTEDEATAVLMPFYADDEGCHPDLHPADGLLLVPSEQWEEWKTIKGYEGSGYLEFVAEQ